MLDLALISGRQLKAARALVGWEQTHLARKSGVAVSTIRRMESFGGEVGARTSTLSLVQKALESAGIEFLNDTRPGVRMRDESPQLRQGKSR
jgi:predicted transcriptional regulator